METHHLAVDTFDLRGFKRESGWAGKTLLWRTTREEFLLARPAGHPWRSVGHPRQQAGKASLGSLGRTTQRFLVHPISSRHQPPPAAKKPQAAHQCGGLSPGLIRGDRRSTHIIDYKTWGPPSKIAWRPSRSAVAYCMGSSHNQKTRGRKTAAIWVRLHGPKIPPLSTSREGHPFTSAPYARPHRKHTDDYHGRRSQARVRALTRRAARGRSHERPA